MPVKTIGSTNVIDTGSIAIGRDFSTFVVQIENLTFTIEFVRVEDERTLIFEQPDEHSLVIKLNNWPKTGGGLTRFPCGTMNGRKLSLAIAATPYGTQEEKSRLVTYTFTLGEQADGQ